MKNMIIKTAAICLAVFSASTFAAEKITITGMPIALEKNGDIYVVPETYKVTPNYQYVLVDGKERACFLDKRPDFVNLDVVSINVKLGSEKATWNCYSPDPQFFVIQH